MADPAPRYTPQHEFDRLEAKVVRIIDQMDILEDRVRELETMLPTAEGYSVEDLDGLLDDDMGDGNFS